MMATPAQVGPRLRFSVGGAGTVAVIAATMTVRDAAGDDAVVPVATQSAEAKAKNTPKVG